MSSEYRDTFDSQWPEANRLIRVLRQRCVDADRNISNHITLEVGGNSKLFMRGTSLAEVFIAAVHDYLQRVTNVQVLEFAIPRFCIECVIFQFTKPDCRPCDEDYFDSMLPSADVLRECLRSCYARYHKIVSSRGIMTDANMEDYIPTVLLCTRKGLCRNVEDIIHEFIGKKPMNRVRSVLTRSKELATMGQTKCSMRDLHRGWDAVNRVVWDLPSEGTMRS